MHRKPPARAIDPARVFLQAKRFWWADGTLRAKPASIQDAQRVALPAMVLSAFASELFLKCILHMEGKTVPPTHRLDNLFRRISDQRKQRIEELWQPERDNNPHYRDAEQFGPPIPKDLLSCLRENGDAFEMLRYIYEDPGKARFYMGELPAVLHKAIVEIRPEWNPTQST